MYRSVSFPVGSPGLLPVTAGARGRVGVPEGAAPPWAANRRPEKGGLGISASSPRGRLPAWCPVTGRAILGTVPWVLRLSRVPESQNSAAGRLLVKPLGLSWGPALSTAGATSLLSPSWALPQAHPP